MTAADDVPSTDSHSRPDWLLLAILAVAGLAAVALTLVLTRRTPGIGPPDGVVYLATADHLQAGRGFTTPFDTLFDTVSPAVAARGDVPLAHWGPGFPTLLAAGDVVLGTSLRAARFVNAGLFACSVVLGGLIVYRIAESRLRAIAAAVVLALLPAMLSTHAIIFADAMLLTAMLATVLALSYLVERPTWWWYALVALFGLAAVSAKYVGLSVVAAAAVTLVLVMPGTITRRLLRGAVVAAPALVLALVWSQRGDSRTLDFHPPDHVDLSTIAGTVGGWFGTGHATGMRHLALAAALALIAVALWTAIGRDLPPSRRALTISLGLTGILVFLTLIFVRTFVEALVAFGHRHFLPIEVAVVLLVASFRLPAGAHRWLRIGAYCAIGVAAVVAIWPWSPRGGWVFLVPGKLTTVGAITDGLPVVPDDPASRFVDTLPRGSVIASDFPENVWLQTGRAAIQLPSKRIITEARDNPDFDGELRELAHVLGDGGYVVLYECSAGRGEVFPSGAELERRLPLERVYEGGGSCIYRAGA